MENKAYVAPEAIVVEFEEKDLLDLSPQKEGNAPEVGW